jgi:hypothetical protein
LVFFFINGFSQQKPATGGIPFNAGIVAAYEILKIKLSRAQQEQVEFYIAVTVYAGVRGRALLIGFDKAPDYLRVKIIGKIQHIVGYAQAERDRFRVIYVLQGTTAAFSPKEFERYANTFMALFKHERGGD